MSTAPQSTACPRATMNLTSQSPLDLTDSAFTLSNQKGTGNIEVIFDYGRCEGGIPVFHIKSASGPEPTVPFRVTYSETRAGIDHEKGDGPFFLFSNAMDSYRSCLYDARRGTEPHLVEARHAQYSQRYQKVSLVVPETSITFSSIGFRKVRAETPVPSTFRCSDESLNSIWTDGVRTVDMCTVRQGETRPAWDVTEDGTRVFAGHWAPCRQGTEWTDKIVEFEVTIGRVGASWGVHMVANGLVLCLDADERKLEAFEGLSNQSSMMPVVPRGSWPLPADMKLSGWLAVRTIVKEGTVTIVIGNKQVAEIKDVQIRGMLSGGKTNTGSVAFGGPEGWLSMYRNLTVSDLDGEKLYKNSMQAPEAADVFADFQVGTNPLACTVDGAKRDRACFGGDVFVMGRSLAYSTVDFEAWRGSIRLLVSHQTAEGYLGNLCPIQTPEHRDEGPPPSYAFYSLTYALLLVVSIKDYWMHSGEREAVESCFQKLEKLIHYADKFTNAAGLIEAPPHLQMTWFPMGGPVFGVSSSLNVAYYDALLSMAAMSQNELSRPWYLSRASTLKRAMAELLWNDELGILRMGASLPADGFSQDVNAYALTKAIVPPHPRLIERLSSPSGDLPAAFQDLGHWGGFGVASPYASGFAVEALFAQGEAQRAVDLLRAVWHPMSDSTGPNYSGAHWEAMKLDGSPLMHDVSLAHGWATWPVHLLPRYVAGLYPLTPGWKDIGVEPVLADLSSVECSIATPAGEVRVSVVQQDDRSSGTLSVTIPVHSRAVVKLPKGWALEGSQEIAGDGRAVTRSFHKL
ncbi:hypothetical protein D7B24_004622 [Verticillium nonalfalfae]|uniref:Alpha-L-rhamnosidase C-terminal domain-containing protein n=1 Tax=Verticillium nonalfalfae TaxID=1051616 RepID=A0A3M9YDJ6_9PEZI|nr:uncharacterized protein D7B24_004622 [Verticillium nonalfalfae]RNJ58539.1 hypothetical protein D7B24_004622 [Verticillium nonalfalfae]